MADIEEIKKRLNIEQVIGDYLTLKKSGTTLKALCPFHTEKTPSFTVSAERGTWHCFGCNEGGDVIAFVQKIDNLSFVETVEKLAARAGVEFKPQTEADKQKKTDRAEIISVLDMATKFFHQCLLKHPAAEAARTYIKERGISAEIVEQFSLGYAPNAWHTMEQLLQKKGINVKWGVAAGLIVQKPGGGYYDRFRGRLLFPIMNAAGQTIAFTGRVLKDTSDDQSNQPKYLNSSESLVFKKSEALYAIHLAKNAIRQKNQVVLMEGQMDVLAAHQFGFSNTVATSGTAVGEAHVEVLKRYSEHLALAFDSDQAGLKAAKAAAKIAWSHGLNPLIVSIPEGKDPDECIRTNSALWEKAVKEAKPAFDYFLNLSSDPQQGSITTLRKKAISEELLELIQSAKSAVEQGEYMRRLANRLGIKEESLYADLSKQSKQNRISPVIAKTSPISQKAAQTSGSPMQEQERLAIGLLLTYFDKLPELTPIPFEVPAFADMYQKIVTAKEQKQPIESVLEPLPKAVAKRIDTLILETLRRHELLDESDIPEEITDSLERLKERDRETRVVSNAQAIAAAFASGDKDRAKQLLKSLEHDMVIE